MELLMIRRLSKGLSQATKMSIKDQISLPPVNREMKVLDRSFFIKKFPSWSLHFQDPTHIKYFVTDCKSDLLQIPGIPFIRNTRVSSDHKEKKGEKFLLLTENLTSKDDLESALSPQCCELIKTLDAKVEPYELTVDYEYWKTDEILKSVLPTFLDEDIPSGFTRTGHIAHINLKAEYKPYAELIGQVILDKNKSVRTVVDKVDSIATEFRTFPMKVIAGEEDFLVTQSESDCTFKFDFSKVYWNSRLHTEHKRLVDSFEPDEVIFDVMAGVGPFAIPSAKKQNIVFANDLNPESFKWLNENITINKVGKFVKSFNEDGREFIKSSPTLIDDYSKKEKFIEINPKQHKKKKLQNGSASIIKEIPGFVSQYIMNLPDSAIEFLDAYVGLYSKNNFTEGQMDAIPNFKLPTINIHHFEKFNHTESPSEEELHYRIHEKVKKQINFDIPFESLEIHLVRKVSPTKPMFCISFQLPKEVAFAS